jgi:hypothetical protein
MKLDKIAYQPVRRCDPDNYTNIYYELECCYKSFRFTYPIDESDLDIETIPRMVDGLDQPWDKITVKDPGAVAGNLKDHVKNVIKKNDLYKAHAARIMGYNPDDVEVYDTEDAFNEVYTDPKVKPDKKDHDDTSIKEK